MSLPTLTESVGGSFRGHRADHRPRGKHTGVGKRLFELVDNGDHGQRWDHLAGKHGCNGLNLGGPLTNNGTINGGGAIESPLSPPPTLTNASGGTITPSQFPGAEQGGEYLTVKIPLDNEGIETIPSGATLELDASATGGTWTGDGELLLLRNLARRHPTFAGLADLYSLYGSVSSTSPSVAPDADRECRWLSWGAPRRSPSAAGNTLALESGCSNSSTTGTMVNDGTISLESGCNGLNLGGPLTNNGTINGGGAIKSPLSPPPTLTVGHSSTIAKTITIDVPIDDLSGKAQSIKFTSKPPASAAVGGALHSDGQGGKSGSPVLFSSG